MRVLGSLEVGRAPGEDDGVRGLEARVLLALAVDAGRVVDDGDLLERVWPAGPPRHGHRVDPQPGGPVAPPPRPAGGRAQPPGATA